MCFLAGRTLLTDGHGVGFLQHLQHREGVQPLFELEQWLHLPESVASGGGVLGVVESVAVVEVEVVVVVVVVAVVMKSAAVVVFVVV